MAKVRGTKGNIVSFQIRGVGEVIRLIKSTGKDIEVGADLGVIKAATFIVEEVQDSIAGNRAEPKSVDTGKLIKNIEVKKLGKASAKVHPKKVSYGKGKSNTQNVALILEKGTSRFLPRRHFKNTEERNKGNIRKIINDEIKSEIRSRAII